MKSSCLNYKLTDKNDAVGTQKNTSQEVTKNLNSIPWPFTLDGANNSLNDSQEKPDLKQRLDSIICNQKYSFAGMTALHKTAHLGSRSLGHLLDCTATQRKWSCRSSANYSSSSRVQFTESLGCSTARQYFFCIFAKMCLYKNIITNCNLRPR